MSLFAFASRARACAVGIALLSGSGVSALAQSSEKEIGLEFDKSEPAPEINAKFRSSEGWIGGDGAHSIDLGNNRTLWLFGDTFVGTIKDGWRSKSRIVHNSAGIQCSPDSPCTFVVRNDANGKATDLIRPLDGRGWLWFQSGILVNDRLYLFLSQMDEPTEKARPQRTPLGQWLAIVENPQDDPREWCVNQVRIPFVSYSHSRDVTFGNAAVVEGKYLYVFGNDDPARLITLNCFLTVARVPIDRIAEMSEWKFLRKGKWSRDFIHADRIAPFMSSDLSVSYMPGLKRYLMVYTDCDVSSRIVARTAPTPIGPWSLQELVHESRDAYGDSRLYCYAGKAHPSLSSDGKLVISYLTSSTDTWQLATNPRLFWPMFVSVRMRDARPESVGTVAGAGSAPEE
ncbi:hypothetical protein AYO47_08345 [Planctomyces sp. SCGC AG-212-M04]|nr:hypothetical protein AYO47_08345 [Planctomyces sp. SCGC AG-212-M04]